MGRAHGDRPDAESVARSTRLVVRDVHLRAHATCATLHAVLSSVLSLALAATAPGDATTTRQREAAAPHEAIRFRWQAPANCPEEPAVRAAIEQRLGGPLAGRTAPRITIIVDVRQQPDHQYGVNVWTVDDDGLHQRQLTDADCQSIAEAAALVAAMAIDVRIQEQANEDSDAARVARKLRDVEEVSPPPASLAPPPSLVEPAKPPSSPAKTKAAGRRMKLRGAVRLEGGVIYGDLRVPGALVRVTPALLLPRWRIELQLSYGPPRKLDLANSGHARLQLVGGGVRACPLLRAKQVEFPLCLGIEAGAMLTGDTRRGVTAVPYAALQFAGGLAVEVHRRLALVFGLEGAVLLKKPVVYDINGTAEPMDPVPVGRLAVRGLAGIEFRFP